jgi:endonuclease G
VGVAVALVVGSVGGLVAGALLTENNLLPDSVMWLIRPAPPSISNDPAAFVLGGAAPSQPHRRVSEAFVSEFDPATRNPRWVVERLRANDCGRSSGAESGATVSRVGRSFREDDSVPAHQRSKPAHYKGSGFDRGHLAPAGDMRSDEAMNDSFRLSNVSPQVGNGFNR